MRFGVDTIRHRCHAWLSSPNTAMQLITYKGVATYRGIEAGWVAVGGPRNKQETARLLQLVNRIRPDYINGVKILPMGY
jgi:hypothetical protein